MKRFAARLLHLFPFRSVNLIERRERMMERKLGKNGISPKEFISDSDHFYFWEGGQGPVILFLHGFGGNALLTWEKELLLFSKHCRVIAPDLLWFGKSNSTREPNLKSQCDALKGLLIHLKAENFLVVGQSYGGFLALGLAKYYPNLVAKIILANCPGTTFKSEKLDLVCKPYRVEEIEQLFICKSPSDVERLFHLVTETRPKFPNFIWKQLFNQYFSRNHESQYKLMHSLRKEQKNFEDLSFLGQFSVQMIWSENDRLFPFDEGKHFAECVNAPLFVIPKVGHAPQFDNRKAFTEVLSRILD
jgi:pimeloyl-ACP methyl ester carboxylesterase